MMTTAAMAILKKVCFIGAYLTLAATVAAPLRAQVPSTTRYAVGYVEVEAEKVGTMRSAFERYRDASRQEAGFGAFELLQQSGNAGLFVVIERWRDQTAIDAHAQADSVKKFREALSAIRVSGYDERPYQDFSLAPAAAGVGAEATFVITHVDVAPPGDATTLLRKLADESRADAGNLRFDILQHTQRANHFTIIEAWRTRAARDRHAAAAHTKAYREALQPLIGSPLDERLMKLP